MELKGKVANYETELSELKSGLNKMQREYDKTKHELAEMTAKSVEYQKQYESLKSGIDQDRQYMENKAKELNEQLDEYAEAYKVLEEKYKAAIMAPKPAEPVKVQPEATPAKREEKKPAEEASATPKDPESNDAIIAGLKKKVAEDVEAKKALRELIKQREDTLRKQKETIDAMQKQLESNKSEIQYSQSQLSQKNSQVKSLTAKINELSQELEKYKKSGVPQPHPEEKKTKPRTAASMVKQKLKEEKLEKVEAKPYLFGAKMDHDDLSAFDN